MRAGYPFERMHKQIHKTRSCTQKKATTLVGNVLKWIEGPLTNLSIKQIMSDSEFQTLCEWHSHCVGITKMLALVVAAVRAQHIDFVDSAFVNFFATSQLKFEGMGEELTKNWGELQSAMSSFIRAAGAKKMAQIFPRALVPLTEHVVQAKSVCLWEDVLTKDAAAAGASLGAEALVGLRATADSILSLWKAMPASAAKWEVELQKVGGTERQSKAVPVKVGMDTALVTISTMAYHLDHRTMSTHLKALGNLQDMLEAQEGETTYKRLFAALNCCKCVRETSHIYDICAKLGGLGPNAEVANSAHMMLGDASKSIECKSVAQLVGIINDITMHIKRQCRTCLASISKHKCNFAMHLDTLSSEAGQLDAETLHTFVQAAQNEDCKHLYNTFRWWNEHLAVVFMSAKELGHDVEAWDTESEVKEAGMLCGSMTLMQIMAGPQKNMAGVLATVMYLKGCCLFDRRLPF